MDDFETELKKDFLLDAVEKLYIFQDIIESIRSGKQFTIEHSRTFFQIIHTLKGNAHASDFEDLAKLFHAFENLLTLLKNEKVTADKNYVEIFDRVVIKIQDSLELYIKNFDVMIDFSVEINLIKNFQENALVVKKNKIAIIDDDKSIREIIIDIIDKQFKADFFEYNDAHDIMPEILKTKFDIIVTDYNMPIMNGNVFIEKLRLTDNINALTPVIFITGEKPDILVNEKVEKEIYYITKPFEAKRVIYYVKLLLSKINTPPK